MLRVRVTTTGYAGAPGLSQFYFVQRSDPATTDLALAEDAYARVQAGFVALKGAMPNVWHWVTDGNLDIMDPATGELTGTIVGGSTGGDAGELSTGWGPLANAMCITWLTQGFINGHRVRGRTFVSPIQALSDSNGSPTAALTVFVNNMAGAIFESAEAETAQVVWHRPKNGTGGSAVPVSDTFIRDTFAVLRSRRD